MISTKSPDDIKKGLECCGSNGANADECPYMHHGSCWDCFDASSGYMDIMQDALALIQQKEAENAEKDVRIQQLEAERDALLKYITDSTWAACDICKHGIDGASVLDCKHIREVGVPCFEWRGVQKEEPHDPQATD